MAALVEPLNGLVQHIATQCNTRQHTESHCSTLPRVATRWDTLQYPATHCNTLQRKLTHGDAPIEPVWAGATHCNTLHHTASHRITLQHHTKSHCLLLQHAATLCNTLRYTATNSATHGCANCPDVHSLCSSPSKKKKEHAHPMYRRWTDD